MNLDINKDTRLCISLAGRPGNFGTRFHNHLYRQLGLNFIYKAFTTSDIAGAVGGVRALGIRGCAVSMPFKESCIPFIDELDPSATAIASVNTIVNDDGFLRAYNTDYMAVAKLLSANGIDNQTDFMLIGSGGMAKAVVAALRDAGFKRGTIVARNEQTGAALAQQYGYPWRREVDKPATMIINVTPIGMQGGAESESLPFAAEIIEQAEIVFDVVALPPETPLIRFARQGKKTVISGAEVIVLQAVEQFVLYTGIRPSAEHIAAAAAYARQE
jgi:shikimate dehydrogenase